MDGEKRLSIKRDRDGEREREREERCVVYNHD